jgi:tRNA pseudouridine38-40 synthase
MRNIKLVLQYDGTGYHGWQIQPDKKTVCGIFKQSLSRLINESPVIHASSRTDSGVHALCQVVNFRTASHIPAESIRTALNSMLPEDICVVSVENTGQDFHACYSAKSRMYRYTIRNASVPSPFDRQYSYHYPFKLDIADMAEAAEHILGTHDFSAFKSARGEKSNRVRTVFSAEISARGEYVRFEISADGFLTYMVRNIAGTLLEIGRGKIPPFGIKDILSSKDRCKAGPTLPARGLFLVHVGYGSDLLK